jgi:hypothetical protein
MAQALAEKFQKLGVQPKFTRNVISFVVNNQISFSMVPETGVWMEQRGNEQRVVSVAHVRQQLNSLLNVTETL